MRGSSQILLSISRSIVCYCCFYHFDRFYKHYFSLGWEFLFFCKPRGVFVINVSCGIKLESTFKIALFRMNTFLLTSAFAKALSQSNKSTARLIRSVFPRFLFDGLSERAKLYPVISKLLSSGKIFQSSYVFDKQIISNLWIELHTLKRTSFAKLCAAMLLRLQWHIENFFAIFCLSPGLSSTSPHSKSKLHLNHR